VRAVDRLFLSPPDIGADERALVLDALDSNWIAPVGPHVDGFERDFAQYLGVDQAAALSSGTAALHLALVLVGVGPDDDVLVPTLTFVATANAVTYAGARPVFLDSERATWNLDPALLERELTTRARDGKLPAAVVVVDLYGQCAEWERIAPLCAHYGVPVIEDAAEALGATRGGRPAGTLGGVGVFSFNGNKVITTSGGGMLVAHDPDLIARTRYLATQAREPTPHYEHSEIGYNYRLSNVLAALGRAQLRSLPEKVARRRAINQQYRAAFAGVPGIGFMPNDPGGDSSNWLTVITVDGDAFGVGPGDIREALEEADIEARPTWKPMHLQPAYAGCEVRGGEVAEAVFEHGLCLPSGSAMTDTDVERVVEAVLAAPGD
jgi:pyridoxal phosphate-dependent aminotransferase EpsN